MGLKFWRISTVICIEILANKQLINNFQQPWKIKKAACKVLLGWTKIEENSEMINHSLRFFYKNLNGTLTFS